jgi:diguanylate cyclase (GGDEF)-like protein
MIGDTRRTRLLAVGLVVAVLVLLQGQLRLALDAAHAFEAETGLALVPSGVILVFVLLLNFQARRHVQRTRQSVHDATSRERQKWDTVFEGLTQLGNSLARATDMGTVRDVVQQMLPQFIGDRPFWAGVRLKGRWESISADTEESMDPVDVEVVERMADLALKRFEGTSGEPEGVEWDGRIYYPLVAGETTDGVLTVETTVEGASQEDIDWRRTTGSAASLVSIAVRNVQLAREVEENGVYDGLTGCFNRTHSMRVLQTELQRARRQQAPFALIMIDLDHFKAVNDTYGHLCGDAILAAAGKCIRDILRNSDTKCRYGGEEFMVLLPDTPRPGAVHVAESLRQQLAETSVTWNGEKVSTTASIGFAMGMPKEVDPIAVIGRADAALYRAKNSGRNRVCEAELPSTPPTSAPHVG